MKTFKLFGWLFIASSFLIMAACSGGGSSGGSVETGTLSLSMTDASSSDYKAVFVTIDEVQVHLGGNGNSPNNWKSVDMPITPLTVNLFDLVNGVREDLGLVDLDAGPYTQMRLIIGEIQNPDYHPFANYVITNTDPPVVHEMKIPSGDKTGIKVVKGFTIYADERTELIFDFDATRSVVQAGSSGQWLLKPTIKVVEVEGYAIIEGRVTDDNTTEPSGLNGVLVTVQKYNATAVDPKDEVEIVASTLTDSIETSGGSEDGHFKLFVKPLGESEHYYLVAYTDGRSPDSLMITDLGEGATEILEDDLILSGTGVGTVGGDVVINGEDNTTAYATLSFRQDAGVGMIEIKSINVLNTYGYSVKLPIGEYTLVASTLFGYETETYSLIVEAGITIYDQDIEFETPD